MSLQESIIELDSGIINMTNDKIHLTGFMSPERLLDYYVRGYDCRFSVGVYPKEDYDIAYIKDNALFIILEEGKEVSRYHFKVIKKDTLKYKDDNNNPRTRVYTIRYCDYSKLYSYKYEGMSLLFNNKEELLNYLLNKYNIQLVID